ncbi:MBL fold metallo-hydrolase [uncultured Psychroserpens sp.]|uniref:MBL fold metallo-hydrolase n=1 Tax=uncultured Psychroserpens sp. TaxID=255436 RepID=UPI002619CB60|nr:MBL fold metallo-hydrolase [uncultured Psychroserpens sp.]
MKNSCFILIIIYLMAFSCKEKTNDTIESNSEKVITKAIQKNDTLSIHPISHATMVLSYGKTDIYVDPTGGAQVFKLYSNPEFVLITDVHYDHLDVETLEGLDLSSTILVAPKAVIDKLPEDLSVSKLVTLNNGDLITLNAIKFEAIPMYNLREEAQKFHSKGRGNGYILTIGNERIYISGDTEDIPEMRNLMQIDKAFICMNQPYTMTVESAADAVLEFKPKQVYPYHYRGTNGFSDVDRFKTLINQGDETIEVIQLNWYKKSDEMQK